MAEPLMCPQGHQWLPATDQDAIADSDQQACPYCGAQASTLIVPFEPDGPPTERPDGSRPVTADSAHDTEVSHPSAAVLTCRNGHQWGATQKQDEPVETGELACPYCGAEPSTHIVPGQLGAPAHQPSNASGPAPVESMAATGVHKAESPAEGVPTVAKPVRPESPAPSTPGRGRYTILQPYARGGLGQISLARDEDIGRKVALKEIRGDWADDADCQRRFLREAEITGQLEHPGIVPVYSLGKDQSDHPYYAMKFVHGRTLAAAIAEYHRRPTPLAFRDLLLRFVDVCQAIAYAHSKNVIHRDLKPANIMLGEYGETLVLDWGLAKRLKGTAESGGPPVGVPLATAKYLSASDRAELASPGITQAGSVVGTPAYMSPEQAAGEPAQVGPPSDIYALGAILYELLAGRQPYEGRTTAEVLDRVSRGSVPAPSLIKKSVPRALEAVCMKAMAHRAADRYASATELAQEIQRWLADIPVTAYPEPLAARLGRWARRHKPLVTGLVALVVTAFVLAVVYSIRLGKEKERTEEARARAEANFEDARSAVDQMLIEVGNRDLANEPGMDLVRQRLVEKALPFYQRFLDRHGTDVGLRLQAAMAYRAVGDIRRMLGMQSEARDAHQQSIQMTKQLVADFPNNRDYRFELAVSLHALGWLLYQGSNPLQALPVYQEALDLQKQLVAEEPFWPEARLKLARTHHDLALLYQTTGRPGASEHFQDATTLREGLVREYPRNTEYRRALAQVHNDHGLLLKETDLSKAQAKFREAVRLHPELIAEIKADPNHLNRHELTEQQYELAAFYNNLGEALTQADPAQAKKACAQALRLCEELTQNFRFRPKFRLELARCHLNLGTLKFNAGDPTQAELSWQEALKQLQPLVQEFSSLPEPASALGQTHNNLAALAYQRRDLNGARQHLEEAIRNQQAARRANPQHPLYRKRLRDHYAGLVDTLVKLEDHGQAARKARELPALYPQGWEELVRAAGFLAACVTLAKDDGRLPAEDRPIVAEGYAVDAIRLLQQAIKNGLSDPAVLRQPTFDSLHSRRDFQDLVNALARPSDPRPSEPRP